ncbi:maltose acetyltransferase domain-containing protein, partial [Actinoplanes sp. NPDC051633]|uniref:maltose acetyltransferase domain-containing protein n=1 Tax=Actinoplanes sp. NPDC051633 TaxID=3155670 RepID=UPI003421C06A
MSLAEQRRRMLAGDWYDDLTDELVTAREGAVHRTDAYNASFGRPAAEREALLAALLGRVGARVHFEPAFRCEFGFNIEVGDDFYANFDCVMLDGGGITIGNRVLL